MLFSADLDFGDLASETVVLNQVGFPLLNSSEMPSCTLTQPCDRAGMYTKRTPAIRSRWSFANQYSYLLQASLPESCT